MEPLGPGDRLTLAGTSAPAGMPAASTRAATDRPPENRARCGSGLGAGLGGVGGEVVKELPAAVGFVVLGDGGGAGGGGQSLQGAVGLLDAGVGGLAHGQAGHGRDATAGQAQRPRRGLRLEWAGSTWSASRLTSTTWS